MQLEPKRPYDDLDLLNDHHYDDDNFVDDNFVDDNDDNHDAARANCRHFDLRARVAALPAGDVALPAVTEGSGAWSKMVPIAYQSFGSGPDLLLITGQDGTMSWWDPALLSDLSSHYTVTMFDLPGAGYSGPVTSPLSLPWLADMTAGLVLTLGLSHPVVLGWGLGGEIAAVIGGASSRDRVLAGSRRHLRRRCRASRPARAVVQLLATPGDTPSELSGLLFPPTTGSQARAQWQSYLFQGSPDWLTAPTIKAQATLQAAVWKGSKLLDYLARVKILALVVSGADDVVFPPANATRACHPAPPWVAGHPSRGGIRRDGPGRAGVHRPRSNGSPDSEPDVASGRVHEDLGSGPARGANARGLAESLCAPPPTGCWDGASRRRGAWLPELSDRGRRFRRSCRCLITARNLRNMKATGETYSLTAAPATSWVVAISSAKGEAPFEEPVHQLPDQKANLVLHRLLCHLHVVDPRPCWALSAPRDHLAQGLG